VAIDRYKGYQLFQQVNKLDLRAREYLNAEARKMIPPNVNVHARESANHRIGTDRENRVNNERTRVLPYAEETQSVACAPNNDRKILHWKKISASDNEMNSEKDKCRTCILFALRAHVRLNSEVTDSPAVSQRRLFGKDRTLVPRTGLQKRLDRVAMFEATSTKLLGLNPS